MESIDKEKKSKQSSAVKENDASKKLHVKMEHCFGIGELEHTFDFTKGNVVTVYAHNGVGKSSFCKAMELYAEGRTEEVRDELYGERQQNGLALSLVSGLANCYGSQPEYTERFSTIKITDESGDVEPKCIKVFGRDFDRTFSVDEMRKALWTKATFVPCNGMSNKARVICSETKKFQQQFGMPVWFYIHEEPTEDGARYKLLCAVETAKGEWEDLFSFEEFQKVASRGERRAVNFLYFLTQWNTWVIEQLKGVPNASMDMLKGYVILDDIADMFDSRNRMAMVEFLRSLTVKVPNFRWIFFSHNYDVYRYLSNRLCVAEGNRFIATKRTEGSENIVTLSRDYYANEGNPFRDWAKNIDNKRKFLALIPFVRQLILFTRSDNRSPEVEHPKNKKILTHLLHYFPQDKDEKGTKAITVEEIVGIFKNYIDFDESKIDFRDRTVFDLLSDTCNTIVETKEEAQDGITEIDLVNKVVLAIGIRLLAEKYMLKRGATVGGNFNRTYALYDSFVKKYGNNPQMEDVPFNLSCCVAFLPDFIHMNSFHYEPLMDLDGTELAEYYRYFKALTEAENDHA